MPTGDGSMVDVFRVLTVLVLVAANGFFVASEFSLVTVRRSRVAELVAAGQPNAAALQRAVDKLDANLAATQLGITISSLALGWIGEPALAHLIEPPFSGLPGSIATAGSHTVAVAIAFVIITALHIVLGELAPKSLALQRTEGTALWVVRPLGLFLFLFRPAIVTLNGLGNLVLRLCGLRPGRGDESLHSPEELKLLISASQQGGLLQPGAARSCGTGFRHRRATHRRHHNPSEPEVVEREDGSLLLDGTMAAHDAFDRLGIPTTVRHGDFHTLAGFVLHRLARIPAAGCC
jgi:putative hemolysin